MSAIDLTPVSSVHDHAPSAPASRGFGLIAGAAAGGVLGSSAAPGTLTISATGLTTMPAVAAADPAPGFRCRQPLETQRHRPRLGRQ
jgi:hypothetical protein